MSADTCTVSVIVAAYNAAAFIPTCLDPMLNQTISDWEVIVIDDHSQFFVESLNARRFGAAAALLVRSPDAITGVAAEALVQAPALARKVVRKVPGLSALVG